MLNMDKEAIKELLEMEAVPVCNILGSLLGRNVKMTVSRVEETDTDGLAGCLPHFNVVIEGRRTANGLTADQLLVFSKEDMVRLTNYIMECPLTRTAPWMRLPSAPLRRLRPSA